nr:hypothetical protein [Tanacetum cinerariifolium]
MFKLDLVPFAPKLLQNRETHIGYLKYTQEQVDMIVEQAKAKQPLDNTLDFSCCPYCSLVSGLRMFKTYDREPLSAHELPRLQCMTPAISSSGLVPNPIPQQPCIPPRRDDWDYLFQPMFDEYFTPSLIVVTSVQEADAPRATVLVDSLVSIFIDQDAPSTRPRLQCMTPAISSSGLVPNPIPQQPCIPPRRDDWDYLFQPMFDEYFTPSLIVVTSVQEADAPRATVLVDSLVSIFIDQDAPSTSITSTQEQEQEQEHSPNIS